MNLSSAFGHVIRKWRLSRNISQGELADLCELDRTFISMLERGERQPSLQTLFTLSTALKVAPDELVRQTERKAKFSSPTRRRGPIPSRRL